MIIGEPCPVRFTDNIKPYQALSDASSNLVWQVSLYCIGVDFQSSKVLLQVIFNPFQYIPEQSVQIYPMGKPMVVYNTYFYFNE